jgi:hypothetical protein
MRLEVGPISEANARELESNDVTGAKTYGVSVYGRI